MNSGYPQNLVHALIEGEEHGDFAALSRAASEDPALAATLREELAFSEWIRQALRGGDTESESADLARVLDDGIPSATELSQLACDGMGTRFDWDRLARHLNEHPADATALRLRLAEDEWLRQALSEAKSEESFIEALETRMWAETKRDTFVEDLTGRLEAIEAERVREEQPDEDKVVSLFSFIPAAVQLTGAAAAVALLGFFVTWSLVRDEGGSAPAVATVIKATPDALWTGAHLPDLSSGLTPGDYELESGAISLRFANGNEVTVQGPASFEVLEESVAFLHSGIALARAGGGGQRGIPLRSRGVELTGGVGLMGIDARAGDTTEAVVFSGDAGICVTGKGFCRDIFALEAVKAEHDGDRLLDVPYNPGAFEKAWTLLAGVEKNIGRVRVAMPGAEHDPSDGEAGEVRVFVENESFEPTGAVETDMVEAGQLAHGLDDAGQALPAGGKLRSYLLELWSQQGSAGSVTTGPDGQIEASLTFDHPVVGVIFSSERLSRTDELVGATTTSGSTTDPELRGLDSEDEWILLSEDRRTLNLRLDGSQTDLDQVRVLVALQ